MSSKDLEMAELLNGGLDYFKKIDGDWIMDLYPIRKQLPRDAAFQLVGRFFEQQMLWRYLQQRFMTLRDEIQLLGKIPVKYLRKSFIIKKDREYLILDVLDLMIMVIHGRLEATANFLELNTILDC